MFVTETPSFRVSAWLILGEHLCLELEDLGALLQPRVGHQARLKTALAQELFGVPVPLDRHLWQEQTPGMGWEQLGGEQIMSDSITMQRTKPDKNMSILISAIEGSNEVMVRVMIATR